MVKVGGDVDPATEVTHFWLNQPPIFCCDKLCDIQMHEEIDKCTISSRQYLSVVVSPMTAPASKFSVQ